MRILRSLILTSGVVCVSGGICEHLFWNTFIGLALLSVYSVLNEAK